jgi:hypothetical protein
MSSESSLEEIFERVKDSIANPQKKEPKKDETICSHHFGYLSKCTHNESIPEECLLCPKVVECIVYQ